MWEKENRKEIETQRATAHTPKHRGGQLEERRLIWTFVLSDNQVRICEKKAKAALNKHEQQRRRHAPYHPPTTLSVWVCYKYAQKPSMWLGYFCWYFPMLFYFRCFVHFRAKNKARKENKKPNSGPASRLGRFFILLQALFSLSLSLWLCFVDLEPWLNPFWLNRRALINQMRKADNRKIIIMK